MLKDSALEKWEYREHTKVKHILLKKYLAAWIPILGSWNLKICYFDGFAGRGEYTDGTPGSPLIALEVADNLSKYFGELICYFIEKDTENFKNLEMVLAREKPKIRNWDKIKVKKENDEFANVIKGQKILAPSFFFVDPFGFSGIPFTVIKEILENKSTEVFFTFMVRDIARFIQLPELEQTFNKLFGTNKWRTILNSSEKPELALISLYREQLHEEAKVKYSCPFRVCTPDKIQTLYYLLHVTNNLKGHSIMKNVMFNQSSKGNFAYLGPEEITARAQTTLFDVHSIQDLKKYLMERFKGKSIGYKEIQEQVCTPWYAEPPYIEKHYRNALKDLEKEGKVKVKRITSKEKGLAGNDMITFLKNNPSTISLYSPTCSKIKIHCKGYPSFNGKEQVLVERVNDGSIVKRFDKTPLPEKATDVICPHFLELKWAYGCPFDCSWCYLKGTFRFRPEGIKPAFKPLEKVKSHVEAFLEQVDTPEILNTGEIADSLMKEDKISPFSKFIISMFQRQNIHKVLFVTKSTNIKNLLEISSKGQVIISFSLNSKSAAERWEKKAPSVSKRLEAASKLYQAGYEVRIRIDPIVPIDNWQRYYLQLIDKIFSKFKPSRITLGTLRGLQSTLNGTKDHSWVHFLKEKSNWGKKIDFTTRYNLYKTIMKHLRENLSYSEVALCKETMAMWGKLGMDWQNIRCNCIW